MNRWSFPFKSPKHIPLKGEPGAFLAVRRNNHIHTGVDIYADDGDPFYAVEDGVVVSIEPFTGVKADCDWWLDTDAINVQGASGTICYGEVTPEPSLYKGKQVKNGELLGWIKRVIKYGQEHPEIPHWKPSMLHMELYPAGHTTESVSYEESKDYLKDPTPFLMNAVNLST